MSRKELCFAAALLVVAALLLANLLRPGVPEAFTLPEEQQPVAISSAGDSAWAIVGNKVYYLSLRASADIPRRNISQVDVQELR